MCRLNGLNKGLFRLFGLPLVVQVLYLLCAFVPCSIYERRAR